MEHSQSTPQFKGLQWSGRTDCGRVRTNNEDSFTGLQFDACEVHHLGAIGEGPTGETDFAFAVSDGIGGARGGEHASRIVVQKLMTLLPRARGHSKPGSETDLAVKLQELFAEIHRALVYLGESDEECGGMEATLSLCWFTPERMFYGHIGDGRIYQLPAGTKTLRQLSHDDTYVGWLLRNGKIKEYEARNHPRRKVLQKALGAHNQFVTPQVDSVACEAGDVFLLCTDGVYEYVADREMHDLVMNSAPQEACDRIVLLANERGGHDNSTVCVVRVQHTNSFLEHMRWEQ